MTDTRDAVMNSYAEREEALRQEAQEALRTGRVQKAADKEAAARLIHRALRQEHINEQPTGLWIEEHRQYG